VSFLENRNGGQEKNMPEGSFRLRYLQAGFVFSARKNTQSLKKAYNVLALNKSLS
jgi:hypothetical protein